MISWGVGLHRCGGARPVRRTAGPHRWTQARRLPDASHRGHRRAVRPGVFVSPRRTRPICRHVLQARINAAPARKHAGRAGRRSIAVRLSCAGPLIVIAERGAIIDGGGRGSVVTIAGADVVLRGFTVRNSGRRGDRRSRGHQNHRQRPPHRSQRDRTTCISGSTSATARARSSQDNRIRPGKRTARGPATGSAPGTCATAASPATTWRTPAMGSISRSRST